MFRETIESPVLKVGRLSPKNLRNLMLINIGINSCKPLTNSVTSSHPSTYINYFLFYLQMFLQQSSPNSNLDYPSKSL